MSREYFLYARLIVHYISVIIKRQTNCRWFINDQRQLLLAKDTVHVPNEGVARIMAIGGMQKVHYHYTCIHIKTTHIPRMWSKYI